MEEAIFEIAVRDIPADVLPFLQAHFREREGRDLAADDSIGFSGDVAREIESSVAAWGLGGGAWRTAQVLAWILRRAHGPEAVGREFRMAVRRVEP
jgi:hypothetical protein